MFMNEGKSITKLLGTRSTKRTQKMQGPNRKFTINAIKEMQNIFTTIVF